MKSNSKAVEKTAEYLYNNARAGRIHMRRWEELPDHMRTLWEKEAKKFLRSITPILIAELIAESKDETK